jgi:hypothetical protein
MSTTGDFLVEMFVAHDGDDDEIVARNVTAGQALSIAVERGGAGDPGMVCWHDSTHRFYSIVRHLAGEPLELVVAVRGPLSPDEMADDCTAAKLFERAFLSDPRRFWDGEILSDNDYARRQRHEESAT